jgi:hypothetical protein
VKPRLAIVALESTLVATGLAVVACVPPQPRESTPQARFEAWVERNIEYVNIPAEVWAAHADEDSVHACADASITHPDVVLRNLACPPSWFRDMHEAAHHYAFDYGLWIAYPDDPPCTLGFGGCPAAERAAEAITDALGYERPDWWGVGFEHLGYGPAPPENVERARAALALSGILP